MTDRESALGNRIGDAIILAAGYGTRMRPLTESIAKPLLPVAGVPALEIVAGKLLRSGARRLHVNLHHRSDSIRRFLGDRDWPVVLHEETPRILDTGGGIGNMAAALSEEGPILLHNGDVVTSIQYEEALVFHRERGALFTMILMRAGEAGRTPPPAVSVDGDGYVTAIGKEPSAGAGAPAFGYCGLAVIEPAALGYFPRGRREGLVPVLRRMIADRPGSVAGFDASGGTDPSRWGEIGTPASYIGIHRRILVGKTEFDPLLPPPPLPLRVDGAAKVDPGAVWRGFLDVGPGAVIERGTELEACVVLGGSTVRTGARLTAAVVFPGGVLETE